MKKTKTKTGTKQLKLSAATVRQLSAPQLDDVHGGHVYPYTGACRQTNNCTH